MIRSFICLIAEPIARSIVDRSCGIDEVVPPTEAPVKPVYTATALPAAIRIDISGVNKAQGHRVRIRQRNDADTAWETVQAWIDIGRARSYIFTQYASTQLIEVGRKYEVQVIAYNIIGDSPEGDYIQVIPLTNIPAIPPFFLEAHDQAIRLTLTKVDDPLKDPDFPLYQYYIEERNAGDTAWIPSTESFHVISDDIFTAGGFYTLVSDTDTQVIIDITNFAQSGGTLHRLINDREYRIRVRSFNDVDFSAWSAYRSGIPMMGVMPAQRPGLPTFNFAPLRYDYDSTGDEVSAVVSVIPKPNVDGVGVTRWLIRYRERGTTDWTMQTVVAQPELDTAYGFRLDEDDIGKTYEVQVAGRNDAGDSAYTSSQTIVVAQPLLPAPVFTIEYNPFILGDALYFTCNPVAPVNPVLPVVGYDIRYREVGTTAWSSVGHALDILNIGYFVELADRFIGKQLQVQMRGVNEYAGGVWSTSQQLQIIDVPNAPTLSLTARPAGFDIDLTAATSGYRATGNVTQYREGTSGDWITTTSNTIRSLKENTLYQVEAWSINPAGRSTSVIATVTTLAIPLVLPLLPTFTVSVVSSFNPFDYSVDPRQNAAEPTTITHWNIRYREQGTTDWTNERVTNVSGATYGNTLDRLTVRGKTYEFQVAAENSDGIGPYAAIRTITFINVPNRPDLFLTAQPAGFDVRISRPPTGSPADSNHFRYREQGTTDWTDTAPNISEVRNLDGLTTYEVQAWTSNGAGESLRVTNSITTLAAPVSASKVFMYGSKYYTIGGKAYAIGV